MRGRFGQRQDLFLPLSAPIVRAAVAELMSNLEPLLVAACGPDAALHELSCIYAAPGAPRQCVHADTIVLPCPQYPEAHMEPLYTFFVALQDVADDMGHTQVGRPHGCALPSALQFGVGVGLICWWLAVGDMPPGGVGRLPVAEMRRQQAGQQTLILASPIHPPYECDIISMVSLPSSPTTVPALHPHRRGARAMERGQPLRHAEGALHCHSTSGAVGAASRRCRPG